MEKSPKIEKLNNTNYYTWKYKIELLLINQGVWTVIRDELPSTTRQIREWRKKDDIARSLIGLNVEDSQLVHIRGKTTALETWNELRNVHEKDTLTNRISLYKKIALLRMNENEKIENHLNQLSELFQKLSDLGDVPSEQWKIGMVFASLPSTYSTLVTALEARSERDLKWSLVYTKLLDEYQRQHETQEYELKHHEERVLKTTHKSYCNFCKKKGHEMDNCFKLKRFQQFEEFEKYLEQQRKIEKDELVINEIHSDNEKEEEVILNIKENDNRDLQNWTIDSGATRHICNNRKMFKDLKKLETPLELTLPNGQKVFAKNQGTCSIKILDENGKSKKIQITNVVYVPELKQNLLSVTKINQMGYIVLFDENRCEIRKKNKVVATAKLKGGLYKLCIEKKEREKKNDEENICEILTNFVIK